MRSQKSQTQAETYPIGPKPSDSPGVPAKFDLRARLLPLDEYQWERSAVLARILLLKRRRRVDLGNATLQFENFEILLYQLHERLRADSAGSERRRRPIIEEHQRLIPGPGELRATLYIDGPDQEQCKQLAHELHRGRAPLSLCIDRETIRGSVIAPSVGAVHYLRFKVPRFLKLSADSLAWVQLQSSFANDIGNTLRRSPLSPKTCIDLAEDLEVWKCP